LIYAANIQYIRQVSYHFKLFILKLNFIKYEKNTYRDLKFLVVYEYQKRVGRTF
jgi:hypothetical protein